ncbi:MAG: tetratricopeptide repeat protein [Spirochaetes bacterium]|nr:tetratricopeptide repeat protein [Spirochaetota bacterium]
MKFIPILLLALAVACTGSDGAVESYRKACLAFQKKEFPQARELFRRALDADGSLLNARLMLSKICYYEKNFTGALEHQDRILRENPDHIGALYWKGRTLAVSAAKDTEAIACLTRVVEQDGHHVPARQLLALLYEKNRKYADALYQYQSIAQEEESLINARANLGILYLRMGLKDKSRGEIAAAIAMARATGLPVKNLETIREEVER